MQRITLSGSLFGAAIGWGLLVFLHELARNDFVASLQLVGWASLIANGAVVVGILLKWVVRGLAGSWRKLAATRAFDEDGKATALARRRFWAMTGATLISFGLLLLLLVLQIATLPSAELLREIIEGISRLAGIPILGVLHVVGLILCLSGAGCVVPILRGLVSFYWRAIKVKSSKRSRWLQRSGGGAANDDPFADIRSQLK